MEGETIASNDKSLELQFDHRQSAGDEEDDDDEESIFPLAINPASTRATASIGRVA